MRIHPLLLIASLALIAAPAAAQAPKAPAHPPTHPPAANAPKKLGVFGDWTAATHQEAGATVCYTFTYAAHSVPALPGRDEVVLTVAERPTARDGKAAVATFAKGSEAQARSPGPHDAHVVDTFSLRGFSAAYAAINKACPPK